MLDKIKTTIKRFNMLSKGDTVMVAVSGGIDSVVLLHALSMLAEECRISILVVHLNHCLRGKESDRDEAFVKGIAKKMGVKFIYKRVDIRSLVKKGDSLQDVAREARYLFFEETAKKYRADKIATGHNMDDQAETVVSRFLRGAGLNGLSGILPKRGKYIRPLLDVSRKEIEEYAAKNGLRFVKDSSNKNTKYLRNRIRLQLMPVLECYNPRLKNDAARLANILARDEDYLKDKAKDIYRDCMKGRGKNAIVLYVQELSRLHDAIKARVFFMAVEELLGSLKGFYSYHVEDFLKLLSNASPNISITLPHNLTLYKEYDVVIIERGKRQEARGKNSADIAFGQELKINGKTEVIADCGLRIADFKTRIQNRKSKIVNLKPQSVAYFDYDKVAGKAHPTIPLIVRSFRPGDSFVPLGMNGHKKVKELFQEKKISKRRRNMVPVLVSGSEIIWVAGMRQAEYGKIESGTKKILEIEYEIKLK
ncbi:MAG: tRNA lysidine(34) synthetase TilS [Deltaproteobacteria bacterium]|nr:tRNA lysidine(34) synthetase TilS [Deltaproteobacteria bacterium]